MRIGPNIPDLQDVSPERAEGSASSTNAARTASGEESESFPEDTVTISSLTNQALQMPEVRQDMVDSLSQSVSSGQYRLDPSMIAAALVGQE
jgi:flagellar biosynthesis anti-sigma factor FlgM